jgi:hypothetical protein
MSRIRSEANGWVRWTPAIAKGLLAGVAGTAAMTASSSIEARIRRREVSTAPARAASVLFGVAPVDELGERRFNRAIHWGYGTTWGAFRGIVDAADVPAPMAPFVHFLAVWAGEQVVLPATGASTPVWKWARTEIGIDAWHHVVFVGATDAAYRWLNRR